METNFTFRIVLIQYLISCIRALIVETVNEMLGTEAALIASFFASILFLKRANKLPIQ